MERDHTSSSVWYAAESEGPKRKFAVFLFGDIRGYTDFLNARGDEAAGHLVKRYAEICREVLGQHDAQEVKVGSGDEVFALFDAIEPALLAAHSLQTRFLQEKTDGTPFAVDIGLAAGAPLVTPEGHHGPCVVLAHRLCKTAGAGEILVHEAIQSMYPQVPTLALQDAGKVPLQGFKEPVQVFRFEDRALGDAALVHNFSTGTTAVIDSMKARTRSYWDLIPESIAEALAVIPEEARKPAIFRWAAMWPTTPPPSITIERMIEAFQASFGTVNASVWAFFRYFDHGRWDSKRQVLTFASRQEVEFDAWFAAWDMNHAGYAFQHSRQPSEVAPTINTWHTAAYCAAAVDSVGTLYRSLGVNSPVLLTVCIEGTQLATLWDRLKDTDQADIYRSLQVFWGEAHSPEHWTNHRSELAIQFSCELLLQADSRLLRSEELKLVPHAVDKTLIDLDQRRHTT